MRIIICTDIEQEIDHTANLTDDPTSICIDQMILQNEFLSRRIGTMNYSFKLNRNVFTNNCFVISAAFISRLQIIVVLVAAVTLGCVRFHEQPISAEKKCRTV